MKTFNDRGLLAYFTQHRVAANLIMVLVVLGGLVSLNRLPTQLFPDATVPVIRVQTTWSEASAKAVEANLTTPMESALANLDDIEEVFSWSSQGFSNIVLRYRLDADMDAALSDVTNFINGYTSLPEGTERPVVTREQNKEAVFSLLVSTEGPVTELRPLVQQFKNDLLARGIAEVDVRGFPDEELRVETDLLDLQRNNMSVSQLATHIAQNNRDNQGGVLSTDFNQISVATDTKVERAEDINNIALSNAQPLSSLATVSRQTKDGARHYVLEGKDVVRLLIFRSPQVDSLETSDILYSWLDDVKPTLPNGVDIVVWWDLAEVVEGNLNMLMSNGFAGLILVVGILFLFLNRHVAWWSAIGIPVSIAGTFMFLYATGGTINFLSVFAFLMALGIIVDDAIVVGEETVTQIENGKTPNEAAVIGAQRMFGPIMASSLTTVAAFLPLLFLPGFFGEMLRPIPIVIIAVIVASLIECFLILPGHLNHGLAKRKKERSKFRRAMDNGFEHFREKIYRPFVSAAINNRGISVLLAVAMCAIAYALPITGKVPFSPDIDVEDNMVTAYISFFDGTSENVVADYTQQLQEALEKTEREIGNGTKIVTQTYAIFSADEGFSQLQAKLVDRDDRPLSNADFLKAWGKNIQGGPDVDYISTNDESSASAGGSTVSFFLAGRDLTTLRAGVEALKERLRKRDGLSNITDDLPTGGDEIIFKLTASAQRMGLLESNVAAQLRQALAGSVAQTYTEYEADIDVLVRLPENSISNTAQLHDLPIKTPNNEWVRFSDIAEFTTTQGFGQLFHNNGQLGVRVNAEVLDSKADANKLSSEIFKADVAPILKQYGLTAEIQGSAQDIKEMTNNLMLASIAGLILIYFILVWVFENYSWPIAVMAAIPFGLTGAILGHWILGLNLTFLSFFGLFGLAGIIINDSIILINRYQELRNEGLDVRPAIIEASCQRLRAVLLTSITTVGGLVPLLMSDSIQAQLVQSMATSLAFGIAYGTLLVLLVIPCLLTYIESGNSLREKIVTRFKKPKTQNIV